MILLAALSMVTFEPGGGRFGDQLITYLHALWVSYQCDAPLYLPPLLFSEELVLGEKHESFSYFPTTKIVSNASLMHTKYGQLSYHPPYYHESTGAHNPYVVVDWEDEVFLSLVREYVAPRVPLPRLPLPEDRITVAMHVRRGTGFDDLNGARPDLSMPMKFPPETFYVDAVRCIALLLEEPLHIHIFTDAQDVETMVHRFQQNLSDLDITFSFCEQGILEDFFAMEHFDCLIYPHSNYSYIPSRIWKYKVRIGPRHWETINGKPTITGMEIELTSHCERGSR